MEKEFGVQIDSLVDVISFGALPIVIFINLELTSVFSILIFILYAICAVSRILKTGDIVKMDGSTGEISIIEEKQ